MVGTVLLKATIKALKNYEVAYRLYLLELETKSKVNGNVRLSLNLAEMPIHYTTPDPSYKLKVDTLRYSLLYKYLKNPYTLELLHGNIKFSSFESLSIFLCKSFQSFIKPSLSP